MKLKQMALAGAMLGSGVSGVATSAHALGIDPSYTPSILLSSPPPSALSLSDVEGFIADAGWGTFDLGLAYKSEVDTGSEYGTGWDYYSTAYYNTPTDPMAATISWDSPINYIYCGDCFLVVKDGNASPYAYIFDISTWNGQDDLILTGFWPAQGAISYVAIYNVGGTIAAIPEADTYAMLLAGLGLVGFAARRKLRKQV
jgi:hypothetical protein